MKIRNKIKHNGINLGYHVIRITWRRHFHNNIDFLTKNKHFKSYRKGQINNYLK